MQSEVEDFGKTQKKLLRNYQKLNNNAHGFAKTQIRTKISETPLTKNAKAMKNPEP